MKNIEIVPSILSEENTLPIFQRLGLSMID
jgi:hypothetical protein